MKHEQLTQIQLLPQAEVARRLGPVARGMAKAGIHHALVRSASNIYYLTGRVFSGYVYIHADADGTGTMRYMVRRPNDLSGPGVEYIRKPEEIPALLGNDTPADVLGLELDAITYALATRLSVAFGGIAPANISGILRQCRAVKTPMEQDLLRRSGVLQTEVYRLIPSLYREGMTDVELQIAIEGALRTHGCLGQFRIGGDEMELFMGNVLTGDNANTPSPYDFAMGGAGVDPSLPVGADGSLIRPGHPVMVDVNGNFTGYMTDMTRCYAPAEPVAEAVRVNEVSRDICRRIAAKAVPGAHAADLYNLARDIAREAGLEEYFMGHRSHAGFVGHGIGIEVNESPILAPRSRDVLAAGNVIAVEPKFVIPGLGAVGIENTYIVRDEGPAEQITNAPEEIISLQA